MPKRKDVEVLVVHGYYKDQQVGKVVQCYREKFVICIGRIQKEMANEVSVHEGIHPFNMIIVKLELDNDQKKKQQILDRRSHWCVTADKEKPSEESIMETS